MEYMEFSAKTVQDAITDACTHFIVTSSSLEYEVIDGQQRLTTLSILYSLIGDSERSPVLRFANREVVNAALAIFYEARGDDSRLEERFQHRHLCYKDVPVAMLAARKRIKGFSPSLDDGNLRPLPLFDEERVDAELCKYILNKVKVFQVCMQDVDPMSYFEVMNNRGEQLEYHELLKERLVAGLKEFSGTSEVAGKSYDDLAEIFDRIWTACSYSQ